MQPDAALQLATQQLNRVREEIGKVIVGQQDVVDGVLICLLAGGHVLLEGVPGLGKTTLLRTLSRVLHLKYSRIQFTPDLMPGDIVGSMIIDTRERRQGAALLSRARSSRTWSWPTKSIARRRRRNPRCSKPCRNTPSPAARQTHELEPPFLVMATQNPIEMEGTYPLPEAQLDRFLMKILVRYPSREDLSTIVDAHHSEGRRSICARAESRGNSGAAARVPPRSGCAACAGVTPSIW